MATSVVRTETDSPHPLLAIRLRLGQQRAKGQRRKALFDARGVASVALLVARRESDEVEKPQGGRTVFEPSQVSAP